MPLFERVRIEIYLPDSPNLPKYEAFLNLMRHEMTWAFGGCSIIPGVRGTYRSTMNSLIEDRVNILYTDLPFSLDKHYNLVSKYADTLHRAVADALEEETILVTITRIYWAGGQ